MSTSKFMDYSICNKKLIKVSIKQELVRFRSSFYVYLSFLRNAEKVTGCNVILHTGTEC